MAVDQPVGVLVADAVACGKFDVFGAVDLGSVGTSGKPAQAPRSGSVRDFQHHRMALVAPHRGYDGLP